MRRDIPNLELCLVPPPMALNSDNHHQVRQPMSNGISPSEKDYNEKNQQLTIFYNGRVNVCDVTEFQARAIILLASQERDKSKTPRASDPSSPLLYSPTVGLSMKKSLQQFLQKRKNRIQATSPYNR